MCWDKESSMKGFMINMITLLLHHNIESKKFIPLFTTVALTQLLDYMVYSGYSKKICNKILALVLSLQILFLYKALKLPIIYYTIPTIFYLIHLNWEPYEKYKSCDKCKYNVIAWKESKYLKEFMLAVWIVLPLITIDDSMKDRMFLIVGGVLLFIMDNFKHGSLGKNWCMSGFLLNFLTYLIYRQ